MYRESWTPVRSARDVAALVGWLALSLMFGVFGFDQPGGLRSWVAWLFLSLSSVALLSFANRALDWGTLTMNEAGLRLDRVGRRPVFVSWTAIQTCHAAPSYRNVDGPEGIGFGIGPIAFSAWKRTADCRAGITVSIAHAGGRRKLRFALRGEGDQSGLRHLQKFLPTSTTKSGRGWQSLEARASMPGAGTSP